MKIRTDRPSTFSRRALAVLTAAVPLALAACDEGPTGTLPVTDEADEAPFAISFAPEGAVASTSFSLSAPQGLAAAVIEIEDVESLILPIGDVEAQLADGTWVLAGTVDEPVDLLNLPEDGLQVVATEVPEGQYLMLRFWLDGEPTITLDKTIRVGKQTYQAGQAYTLTIPSADEAGVRLVTDFTVGEDGEALTVLVDGAAMIRRVVATGSGMLKIDPVLTVVNDAGERVGEDEDAEDDAEEDENEVEVEGFIQSTDVDARTFTLVDGATVRITDATEMEGDFLSLVSVAEAVAAGRQVEAEVEGAFDADGTTILAAKVEFETEDDEGDEGDDAEEDEEVEADGLVTALNGTATDGTLTIDAEGTTVLVRLTEKTQLELGDGLADWAAVVAAFEAGTALRAEVEGELNGAGELVAWEVEVEIVESDDD